MALGSLTYEVPGARRWSTFVPELGIAAHSVQPPHDDGQRCGRARSHVFRIG